MSNADKGAVGLIPALELASLTLRFSFHFNFFLIPPLLSSPHEPFSTQLRTVTAPFYLLVTAKFPFALFNETHLPAREYPNVHLVKGRSEQAADTFDLYH